MKRLFYLAFGLAVVLLVPLQIFGGFRPRRNPASVSNAPPPLVKEAPPPELLVPAEPETKSPFETPAVSKPPAATPSPQPPPEPEVEEANSPPPVAPSPAKSASVGARDARKPVLQRESAPPSKAINRAEQPKAAPANAAPVEPQEPAISPEEMARREMAREIVVQSSPAMARLLTQAKTQKWEAQPEKDESFLVTFTISDESSGNPVQYIWRVDTAKRTASPLNYYARKLP